MSANFDLLTGRVLLGRQVGLRQAQAHLRNVVYFFRSNQRLTHYALTYTLANSMIPVGRRRKFCTFFEVA